MNKESLLYIVCLVKCINTDYSSRNTQTAIQLNVFYAILYWFTVDTIIFFNKWLVICFFSWFVQTNNYFVACKIRVSIKTNRNMMSDGCPECRDQGFSIFALKTDSSFLISSLDSVLLLIFVCLFFCLTQLLSRLVEEEFSVFFVCLFFFRKWNTLMFTQKDYCI